MGYNTTKTPPKWDAAGAEPSNDLQTNGFAAGYKPPAAYFNYLFNRYTACIKEIQDILKNMEAFLPLSGGELTGELIVNENFQVRKTFDNIPYRSYIRPINYSVGSNGDYSTGLIHYKNNANNAQLMFNKDGVMLRDNINAKAYQMFGQHNTDLIKNICLPLTGGTMSGDVYIAKSGDSGLYSMNEKGSAYMELVNDTSKNHAHANFGCFEGDASTWNGSTNYMTVEPFSFGVKDALLINRRNQNGEKTQYRVYHSGNRPQGTYTGNGKTTARQINVGGTGSALLVGSDAGYFGIVTALGAVFFNLTATNANGSVKYFVYTTICYDSGILYITGNDNAFNKSGTVYMYGDV